MLGRAPPGFGNNLMGVFLNPCQTLVWSESVMRHHIHEVDARALPPCIFRNIFARRWPLCICKLDELCFQNSCCAASNLVGSNGKQIHGNPLVTMAWHGFLPSETIATKHCDSQMGVRMQPQSPPFTVLTTRIFPTRRRFWFTPTL